MLNTKKKQPVFTARILDNDASISGALNARRSKKSRFKIAGVLIVLASLLGMFLMVMGAAVTGNAQKETLNACLGGVSWYGVSPVASSSLALTSNQNVGTWQKYGVNKDGVNVPQKSGEAHTPNEYYGAFFPFTSNYDNLGSITGPDGAEMCGMPDGYLSATIPSLIFAIGAALSSLMIAVYGWATNPDILNALIAPIDCIVAGGKEGGGSLSADSLGNFAGGNVGNINSIYGVQGAYACPADREGLVESFYLAYILPVVFIGALWMFWQGSVKRRTSQSLQGALWMIIVGALSIVFLYQPTFIAVKINDGVSSLNNQLLESVLGATATPSKPEEKNNDMCYLPSEKDVGTGTGPLALENLPTNFADIGPRRASCMLWKILVYDAWAYGQFGESINADIPLSGKLGVEPLSPIFGKPTEDAADARALMIKRMEIKFPNLSYIPLGLAQIEATVLDRDELIASRGGAKIDPKYTVIPNIGGVGWTCLDGAGVVDDSFCGINSVSVLNDLAYAEMNAIKDQIAFTPGNSSWSGMWAGQSASQRYSASIVAVVGAMIGGLVITVLGFVNVLYQLGMLLLILIAPMILLIGLHPGAGRRIATKWLEALLSTAAKRVLVSFLLVVLISIYSVIYAMENVGWLQKVLLIAAVGIGILMYRKQLTQMVGVVNLGSGGADSYNAPAQQAQQKVVGGAASSGGSMVGAAVAGGGLAAIAGAGAKGASSGGGSPVQSAKSGMASGQAAAQRSRAKKDRERRSNASDSGGNASSQQGSQRPKGQQQAPGGQSPRPQQQQPRQPQGPTPGGQSLRPQQPQQPRQQPQQQPQQSEQGGAKKATGGAVKTGVGAAETAAGVASSNPVMIAKGVAGLAGGAKDIGSGAVDMTKEENENGPRKGPEGDNPRPKKDDDSPV